MPDMPQHVAAVCGPGALWAQLLCHLPQPPPGQPAAERTAAVMPIQVGWQGTDMLQLGQPGSSSNDTAALQGLRAQCKACFSCNDVCHVTLAGS